MSTLVFDLDGTLLDVRRRHYKVYEDGYRELGIEPLNERAYWHRRLSGEGTFQIAGDLPGNLYSQFTRIWIDRVESRKYLPYGSLFAGVAEMLAALGTEHRLLLVTLRRNRDMLMEELRARDLENAFEKVLSPRGEGQRDKTLLLQDTYINGDTCVIGDSEADIQLAQDSKARMIALSCGVRSSAFLMKAGAPRVLDSVSEVPSALAVAA